MLMTMKHIALTSSNLDLAQSMINQDLQRVDQWLADNSMIPNVKKTKSVVIGSRQALKKANNIEIYLDNEKLDDVSAFVLVTRSPTLIEFTNKRYFLF